MERTYESMMILKWDLDDNGRQEVFDKITKKIEQLGGKTVNAR